MAIVRTVSGDISPDALGITYAHEHLITQPPAHITDPDLVMDSESAAAMELQFFRQAGGRALVEMSTPEYGRNPAAMRRLAQATGIHVISTTGWIKEKFFQQTLDGKTVDDIAAMMIHDVHIGMDGTDVRAGVIKGGTSKDVITPMEETILRAAARAHHATGAPISTHTEAGTMALEQVDILTSEGVPPERILIGHTDRKLDFDYHLRIAERGVNLGYDQFSKEKYAPDSQRIDFICRMVEAGHASQIFISGDLARRSYWTSYGGGPGLTFILWRIVPWMREEGISQETIEQILIGNPRRLFAFDPVEQPT